MPCGADACVGCVQVHLGSARKRPATTATMAPSALSSASNGKAPPPRVGRSLDALTKYISKLHGRKRRNDEGERRAVAEVPAPT